jgi:hypothetical protein
LSFQILEIFPNEYQIIATGAEQSGIEMETGIGERAYTRLSTEEVNILQAA